MLQTRRRKCRTLAIICLIFFFLSMRTPSTSNKEIINSDQETHIIWLVDSEITTKKFPIGFITTESEFNYSIITSWGKEYHDIVSGSYSLHIVWIDIQEDDERSSGTLAISIDGKFLNNYSFTWSQKNDVKLSPQNITMNYFHSGYWSGSSCLTTRFDPSEINIEYNVKEGYYIAGYPYEEDFAFTRQDSIIWLKLVNYLKNSSNVPTWTSWAFPPAGYQGPLLGMYDGGKWIQTVTIYWNDSSFSTYLEMVDYEGGTGARRITLPEASGFNSLLLSSTKNMVEEYLSSKNYTPVSSFSIIFNIFVLFLFVSFKKKSRF